MRNLPVDTAAACRARSGCDLVALSIGTPRYRALGAVLALAAWPLSAAVDAAAGIALLTAVVAGTLAVESRAEHATVEA
jgi:hypothetical protein